MAITKSQLDALARHDDGKSWNDVPDADKDLIKALRSEIKATAEYLAENLQLATEPQPFTSHPTPNGRAPNGLWGCVFPLGSANKSYAFELFFIFTAEWLEYGFAAGAGESQVRDAAARTSLDSQFASARARLAEALQDDRWMRRAQAVVDTGSFSLRQRWGKPPNAAPDFGSLGEWVKHAVSDDGAGSTISAFSALEDVVAAADGYRDELKSLLQPLAVFFDRAHPKRTKEEIARAITDVLGVEPVTFSSGSTEPKELFTTIIDSLALTVDKKQTKDKLAEAIATLGGLAWDATCYSAGSTVTHEGLERVLGAVHALRSGQPPSGSPVTSELTALEEQLSLAPGYLAEIDWLVRDKQQVVFFGPPGTGKTYVARRYAEWLTGDPSRVEVIQFHPSYAYEDFLEGIRPVLEHESGEGSAGLRYALVPGLLRQVVKRMTDDKPWVLLIDEINRANLPRVFGELLYLLEYRDDDLGVRLQYSGQRFSLPKNLFILGTMNTADRSIALVDFALRRRFHFVNFPADPAILARWLQRNGMSEFMYVADRLRHVNEEIGRTDFAVGFSYFMRKDLTDELVRRIWRHSIVPTLEEYFLGERDAADFSLEAVAARMRSREAPIPSAPEPPEPGLVTEDDEPVEG